MVHAHSKQADEFGRTLLHTAAWWGRVEISKYLISNGATLNEIDSVRSGSAGYIILECVDIHKELHR
jgi:hypothetical protein